MVPRASRVATWSVSRAATVASSRGVGQVVSDAAILRQQPPCRFLAASRAQDRVQDLSASGRVSNSQTTVSKVQLNTFKDKTVCQELREICLALPRLFLVMHNKSESAVPRKNAFRVRTRGAHVDWQSLFAHSYCSVHPSSITHLFSGGGKAFEVILFRQSDTRATQNKNCFYFSQVSNANLR